VLYGSERLVLAALNRSERLDPAKLFRPEGSGVNIAGGGSDRRAWRDIWSAGQGIGAIKRSGPARNYIDWLVGDYARARTALGLAPHG
jgi:nitronate monooxygenase